MFLPAIFLGFPESERNKDARSAVRVCFNFTSARVSDVPLGLPNVNEYHRTLPKYWSEIERCLTARFAPIFLV